MLCAQYNQFLTLIIDHQLYAELHPNPNPSLPAGLFQRDEQVKRNQIEQGQVGYRR